MVLLHWVTGIIAISAVIFNIHSRLFGVWGPALYFSVSSFGAYLFFYPNYFPVFLWCIDQSVIGR